MPIADAHATRKKQKGDEKPTNPKKNKNYPKKGRQVYKKRLIFVANIFKEG
jgi:hypothetical protein